MAKSVKKSEETRSGEGVSVLEKISALLEVLATRDQAAAAELAELLDEPRSSVHRMIRQLHEIGWIEPGTSRGQWTMGLHLFRLGSAAVTRMDVRRAALPHMRSVFEATGESVFLVIRRNFDAVCIERIEGRFVHSIALTLGGSMPLHSGAGPMSLLAWADGETHRDWLIHVAEHGLDQKNRAVPPTVAIVEAELAAARDRGYTISDRDVTPGIGAVGAPVYDYRGRVVAGLSVSGIAESVLDPANNVAESIVEAARRVSFDLGFRDAALVPRRPID